MAEVDTIQVLDKDNTAREIATLSKLIKSVGTPTLARVAATDGTPATLIELLKQLSYLLANTSATKAKQDDTIAAINALVPLVDGLEGLLTTNNASNTSLAALITTSNQTLNAIQGFVDGLEALFATNNASNTTVVSSLGTGNATAEAIRALLAAGISTTSVMASGGNIELTTNAASNVFEAFASRVCKQVTIVNDTGFDIEVQQGATGPVIPVFDRNAFTFFGITNANQLGVRRKLAGVSTVKARWEN